VRAKIIERWAALAARQLLYYRERLGWMEERGVLAHALLESYLALAGEEETVLPGGYVLFREEGRGTPVRVRRVAAGGGFSSSCGSTWAEKGSQALRGSPRLRRTSQGKVRCGGARFPPKPGIARTARARLSRPPADLAWLESCTNDARPLASQEQPLPEPAPRRTTSPEGSAT
jgi:hypothetical protein